MKIDLDNPRIKVKNSKTEKQCCIVCDQFIATKDEEGNVEATKILSISNNPGSGKIAFSKNLHIHIGCVEAFCEQLLFKAAHEDPNKTLAWHPMDENA